METSARDSYLETQILTATPQRLRLMLIDATLRRARAAIEAWQAGRDDDARLDISRCRDMVTELVAGIEPDRSPLARQVLGIYMFVYSSLVELQFAKDEARLSGLVRVLEEERVTWQAVCEQMPDRPSVEAATSPAEEVAPQRVTAQWSANYGQPAAVVSAVAAGSLSLDA
jgi:flagellar protein FliS